ncbi:hypothetical protein K438DRAFT_1785064 [Mycena galopus ATCC 62051]|nr:hypothetical protein K438DRAFT_1785064 [Mycena galopus ATCC 62051]
MCSYRKGPGNTCCYEQGPEIWVATERAWDYVQLYQVVHPSKEIEPNENPPIDASLALQRALDLAERLCDLINLKLLRLCLVHDDSHDRNCLVHGSQFSGLVDWEQQNILPTCVGMA